MGTTDLIKALAEGNVKEKSVETRWIDNVNRKEVYGL